MTGNLTLSLAIIGPVSFSPLLCARVYRNGGPRGSLLANFRGETVSATSARIIPAPRNYYYIRTASDRASYLLLPSFYFYFFFFFSIRDVTNLNRVKRAIRSSQCTPLKHYTFYVYVRACMNGHEKKLGIIHRNPRGLFFSPSRQWWPCHRI